MAAETFASSIGILAGIMLRLLLALRAVGLRALPAIVDRRVPARLKLIVLAAALLIISPLNILGEIPLLGMLDDAGLLALVLVWFTRASAPYVQTIEY